MRYDMGISCISSRFIVLVWIWCQSRLCDSWVKYGHRRPRPVRLQGRRLEQRHDSPQKDRSASSQRTNQKTPRNGTGVEFAQHTKLPKAPHTSEGRKYPSILVRAAFTSNWLMRNKSSHFQTTYFFYGNRLPVKVHAAQSKLGHQRERIAQARGNEPERRLASPWPTSSSRMRTPSSPTSRRKVPTGRMLSPKRRRL